MKTLLRSLAVAAVVTLAGGAAPAAAQRVSVDIHLGAPNLHYRYYGRPYRVYRGYHRPYAWRYAPHAYYRRPVIVHRPLRRHHHRQYQWH